MEKVLFVALGGGIGAGLRYLLTELANLHGGAFFPYGTVLANIIGSFCIGVFFVFFSESSNLPPVVKLFFVTGILGGFTTFSTFALESIGLIGRGETLAAGAYMVLSCALGMAAALAGQAVAARFA